MNNQGSVTSRPLKMKHGKDRLSFNFGDDSNKYRKEVYIGDSMIKNHRKQCKHTRNYGQRTIKKIIFRMYPSPILFILFIIIVIKFTIIKNTELASFKIPKALQQGLNKIQVQV